MVDNPLYTICEGKTLKLSVIDLRIKVVTVAVVNTEVVRTIVSCNRNGQLQLVPTIVTLRSLRVVCNGVV